MVKNGWITTLFLYQYIKKKHRKRNLHVTAVLIRDAVATHYVGMTKDFFFFFFFLDFAVLTGSKSFKHALK